MVSQSYLLMKERDEIGKEKIRLSKILYTEVHVFDNHQIPKKLRGKTLFLRNLYTGTHKYTSVGHISKTGKHFVSVAFNIRGQETQGRANLILSPKSYSLKEISRADKGG